MTVDAQKSTWFQRFLLPGFAFKAVVIGGGYATGRELAEYFLPSGPWGGLAAILLSIILFSLVCALTFLFARAVGAQDYRTFFRQLLGPAWFVKLIVDNEGRGTRAIHRTVGSGGSFGASPLEQHVGLGRSARIVELEIWWPATNTRQRITGIEKNQSLEITELARSYTRIERRPVSLGGRRKAG